MTTDATPENDPPEPTPRPRFRSRLATEEDLRRWYGPGMLMFGSPVQPQPPAPEATDNNDPKGS